MTSSSSWRLDLLGPPRLHRPDGQEVSLHAERNLLAVLSYVALEGPSTRSRLAGLLWPETLEGAARNNLVHLLRRAARMFGDGLLLASDLVRLDGTVRVDVRDVLEGELADEGMAPLLAGVDFDGRPELSDWLLAWRERLGALGVDALTRRAAAHEDAG
ncbi:AfsR/SARP family transcriptional regulator, partial [Deinococcus pimensis]|uniref:AfsR/SARP family transcriptional regulator n=1 Tax=Deinococcus pimensis TaxID=309888 RepID=UPI003CCBD036